jgi:hypothetical protein
MRLLSSIELPHWLMIGGAILIAMSLLGLAFARNKEVAANPDSPPIPRPKMPPLPRLLGSSRHGGQRMTRAVPAPYRRYRRHIADLAGHRRESGRAAERSRAGAWGHRYGTDGRSRRRSVTRAA